MNKQTVTETNIAGVDCGKLFDQSINPVSFCEDPRKIIPNYGSIVYTIWNRSGEWIYVGIGGLGQSPATPLKKRNPVSRILQHQSGRRSGDQFCIYVHDYYIVPRIEPETYQFIRGDLDRMTKDFIRNELCYRFIVLQTEDSIEKVRKIESKLKSGYLSYGKPLLNGV